MVLLHVTNTEERQEIKSQVTSVRQNDMPDSRERNSVVTGITETLIRRHAATSLDTYKKSTDCSACGARTSYSVQNN